MSKCRTQNEARRDRNAMGLNILYVDQAEDCKHAPPIRGCFFPLDCDSSSCLADIICGIDEEADNWREERETEGELKCDSV